VTGSSFLPTAALLGLLGLALGFTPSIQASLARRTATGCEPGSVKPLVSPVKTYAFDARGVVGVYRKPGGRAFARFGARNANGVWTVFAGVDAVLGARCRAAWLRVLLPMKPNGSTGYVRATPVKVRIVRSRLVIGAAIGIFGVLGGPHRLASRRPRGAPWDEPSVAARSPRLERLHSRLECGDPANLAARSDRHPGSDSGVAG
jgi:hypothetical protein